MKQVQVLKTEGGPYERTLETDVFSVDVLSGSRLVVHEGYSAIVSAKPVLELIAQFKSKIPGLIVESDLRVDDGNHPACNGLDIGAVIGEAVVSEAYSYNAFGEMISSVGGNYYNKLQEVAYYDTDWAISFRQAHAFSSQAANLRSEDGDQAKNMPPS